MRQIRCIITRDIIEFSPNELLKEDFDFFCPHCGLKLESSGRKFKHAPLPFELRKIRSVKPGGRGQGIILVHGFTNNLDKKIDYSSWARSIREAGWNGSIWGLWWNAGEPWWGFGDSLITGAIPPTMYVFPPSSLLGVIYAGYRISRIKGNWDNSKNEANLIGALFGKYLLHNRPPWTKKNLILMGFSLGARTVCKALETGGLSKKFIADEVYLYGGAFSIRAPWSSIARGVRNVLHNHFSIHDQILKFIYPIAEKNYHKKPIGRYQINSRQRKIKNWDVSEYIANHGDYEKTIGKFEQFN